MHCKYILIVYTLCVYILLEVVMDTLKFEPLELTVFKSGNSAALRLPKALGFEPGERIVAYRDGEALVLRHADSMGWPVGYFDSWEESKIELPDRNADSSRGDRMKHLYGEKGSF